MPGSGIAGYIAGWRPSSVSPQAAEFARAVVTQAAPGGRERVPLENRTLRRELRFLEAQAARMYSLIRPLRTDFRRIWRAWKFPAVRQGGWCSASGTRWPGGGAAKRGMARALRGVQTLSRLNRIHPLKSQDDVHILDFVN